MTKHQENVLFFKNLLRSPLKTGAFFPSSQNLARAISQLVVTTNHDGGYILEIGAGTGRLTRALLDKGILDSQLLVLEMQPTLVHFLKNTFKTLQVIQGDARYLLDILPEPTIGHIHTIVSSIPMVNLKFLEQKAVINAYKQVLTPKGRVLQFTYRPGSPLPAEKLGLSKRYLGSVLRNVPPANIWEYTFQDEDFKPHPQSAFAFVERFKTKRAQP